MNRYRNLSGTSGVFAYEIGADYIIVEFKGGRAYLYTYNATGRSNIERIKVLAAGGRGLGTFINTHVRKKYAKKIR